jgi:hypothetical protein
MPDKTDMERYCAWIFERLTNNGKVSSTDFVNQFSKASDDEARKRAKKKLLPSWNRAEHATFAILSAQKRRIFREDSSLRLEPEQKPPNAKSDLAPYTNPNFQPDSEAHKKEQIGGLIADFLSETLIRGKTIFLGSGTTILHVGLKMCEANKPYSQRFVTVNIALAAAFCARDVSPVSKISIPEGVLETQTFRFSTMPGPGWPLTVSVVAADGCYYDDERRRVMLYANEESVATNTSLFVKNTKHTVVVCLTSEKITRGFAQNPNTGPPIAEPKKGVIRVLVTDTRAEIDAKLFQVFENDGWLIVTKKPDWEKVLATMERGETSPRALD